jgi:hypothetical protein
MEFAHDPIPAAAAADLLRAPDVDAAARPWLLVDAALYEGDGLQRTLRRNGWRAANALQLSALYSFGDKAPQLIELNLSDSTAETGIGQVPALDPRAPAVSCLWTTSNETQGASLLELFGYLAHASIDDDLDVNCRFADTRVLPSLLLALNESQVARVAGTVRLWRWLSREGRVCERLFAEESVLSVQPDPAPRLRLDQTQFGSMLRRSEPDVVFEQLRDRTAELVPSVGLATFHARLDRLLERATQLGLDQPADRLQFVVLSLSLGDGFYQRKELEPTWAAIQQQKTSLWQATQTWPDALWNVLESAKPIAEHA